MLKSLSLFIFILGSAAYAQEERPIYFFQGEKPLTYKTTFQDLINMIGFPDTLSSNGGFRVKQLPEYTLTYFHEDLEIVLRRDSDHKKIFKSGLSEIHVKGSSNITMNGLQVSKMDTINVLNFFGHYTSRYSYDFEEMEITYRYELTWKKTKVDLLFNFSKSGQIINVYANFMSDEF